MTNYLTVIVVALLDVFILSIWYSPLLFANLWSRLTKIKLKLTGGMVVIGIIGSLITSYVLSFVVSTLGLSGFWNGVMLGALVWIGFIVPFLLNEVIYEKRDLSLYVLNVTGYLLILTVSAGIFAVWH